MIPWLPAAATEAPQLPLTCHRIPNGDGAICAVITPTSYGPFDDIIFYHRNAEGHFRFLRAETGTVSIFAGLGFSPNGDYVWTGTAEEGHPMFHVYRTEQFLRQAQPMGVLSITDYGVDHLDQLFDDGRVLVGVMEGHGPCVKLSIQTHDPDRCHRLYYPPSMAGQK